MKRRILAPGFQGGFLYGTERRETTPQTGVKLIFVRHVEGSATDSGAKHVITGSCLGACVLPTSAHSKVFHVVELCPVWGPSSLSSMQGPDFLCCLW